MVHVPHDGNHRRTIDLFTLYLIDGTYQFSLDIIVFLHYRIVPHLFHDQGGSITIQWLVDGYHHAHLHQFLDHLSRLDRHALGQIGNRYGLRYLHVMDNRGRGLYKSVLGV